MKSELVVEGQRLELFASYEMTLLGSKLHLIAIVYEDMTFLNLLLNVKPKASTSHQSRPFSL